MDITKRQDIPALLLRISLSAGFLSAVASRLGLWGKHSSGWAGFVKYTAETNSFLPENIAPALAVLATIAELGLGILLLAGFRTAKAALSAAVLTLLFAMAMTVSYGIKEPLDYSVFVFSAGAFFLSRHPHHIWSIDNFLKNQSNG